MTVVTKNITFQTRGDCDIIDVIQIGCWLSTVRNI
jgi:hypothetical protein